MKISSLATFDRCVPYIPIGTEDGEFIGEYRFYFIAEADEKSSLAIQEQGNIMTLYWGNPDVIVEEIPIGNLGRCFWLFKKHPDKDIDELVKEHIEALRYQHTTREDDD